MYRSNRYQEDYQPQPLDRDARVMSHQRKVGEAVDRSQPLDDYDDDERETHDDA